jgi:hypothetical protein
MYFTCGVGVYVKTKKRRNVPKLIGMAPADTLDATKAPTGMPEVAAISSNIPVRIVAYPSLT